MRINKLGAFLKRITLTTSFAKRILSILPFYSFNKLSLDKTFLVIGFNSF